MAIAAVLAALLAWGYFRVSSSAGVRLLAAALKVAGIAILLACLLEPLLSGVRASPEPSPSTRARNSAIAPPWHGRR